MNRVQSILLKAMLLTVPLGAMVMTSAPSVAQAQMVAPPPPPPEFVATAQPEYYEGRPVYYYHNAWYYREGNGWNYYRGEPAYLRDRRSHWGSEHDRGDRYHYRR